MSWPQVLVAVAQVAAGGTIVQGIVALVRRRSELRKLDRESESVAVETADRLIVMMRKDLQDAKEEIAQVESARAQDRERHIRERDDLRRQIEFLSEAVSRLRAELVVARTEIERIKKSEGPL